MSTQTSWLAARLPCLCALRTGVTSRELPAGSPYLAELPALIGAALLLLLLSGFVLAAYYNPWHAFDSVSFIAREVNQGWLVQDYHTTAATMVFAALYLHLFRELLARAYRAPGELAWMLTVKLLAVLLLTGWLGFVLMGGAAGGAALTSAANGALRMGGLIGAMGGWIFGGAAGQGTLARLAVLHALLALGLVLVLWLLLSARRALPVAGPKVALFPHGLVRFAVMLAGFAFVFSALAFYAPRFGMPFLDNLPAGGGALPLAPALPWFLALWGAIASVAHGLWGIAAAFVLLFALPWLDRGGGGRIYTALLWLLALDVLALTLCPAPLVAMLGTVWFFVHFLVLTPLVTALEAV